ncbi:energy-coupling factor ABC transporter ATP-binding protein [Phytobacter massiliensis]|uniref:energy-coupling factor ABC transporter ATP-binding protein n=1 Tax=Phytobacter massiliensis TaxID=1485952 RepID=UPI0002DFA72C|nr:ATP-binding cassette domain-containing protein [Phytobacter massiliensis]
MLNLENVSFRWPGAAQNCIDSLSLNLTAAQWVALTGDNGAGKSTLLRLMAGLLTPTHGAVKLQNQPLTALKNRQRAAHIGVLFQEAEHQIFHSRVVDEVEFGLRLQKLPAAEISRRAADALALCELTDVATAHPLDLHSAQRRMVAVACLEALAPPLLLLDEPSRDFDDRWLGIFERWLMACQQRGTTVLAISHDYAFIDRYFARVLRLQGGKIAADGTPDEVLTR